MNKDSLEIVKNCEKCQRFANILKTLQKIYSQFLHHGASLNGGSILLARYREMGCNVRSDSSRLFHKVGKSRGPSHHYHEQHQEIPLEISNMSL
jgi:hypothetical protein